MRLEIIIITIPVVLMLMLVMMIGGDACGCECYDGDNADAASGLGLHHRIGDATHRTDSPRELWESSSVHSPRPGNARWLQFGALLQTFN